MTGKIFKSIFLSAIAVFILSFAMACAFSYSYYGSEVERELGREAEYVKVGIESFGHDYLYELDVDGVRITHIAADGKVIFDTRVPGENIAEVENHLEREEVREALLYGEGTATRYSSTLSERTVYYAVLCEDGTVLRVAAAHSTAFAMLLELIRAALIIFLIVTLLAFLAAKQLSKSIVRPINEIDLEHPESAKVYDELKPMMEKLTSQNLKISRHLGELQTKQNEFTSITSNMSEGMVIINSRTMVLSCNDAAKRILGVTDELPKSVLSLRDSESFRAAVGAALSGENGYDTITTEDKHYSVIVTPVLNEGMPEGAVVVIIDDTEKERREALRREFTSNVSHELKTPLTSISGFAELIRCGMAEGEEARHFAGNIHKEAARLITLVGDIIRLTQLDGGEIPYDELGVPLLDVAEEVVGRLENVAEAENITLSVTGDAVTVPGNRIIVEEMIYNLCDNAIKYNKPGGYVRVSVESRDGVARLSVSDNGIGIPRDKQDRVFERFYRVDKSHSRLVGGTGLGLSIVKHSAAYHGASVSLRSVENVGTTVSVEFTK